jgi:hypothetical protein
MPRKKKKTKPQPKKKPDPKKTHVETLLYYTERNITGCGSELDVLFTAQAKRLRELLESL